MYTTVMQSELCVHLWISLSNEKKNNKHKKNIKLIIS